MSFVKHSLAALIALTFAHGASASEARTSKAFEGLKDTGILLRQFLTNFPKGADLHNHLYGAVYAESWLDWAADDGLCIELSRDAIVEGDCLADGFLPAAAVRNDRNMRREFVEAVSVRAFEPTPGFNAHDKFFETFTKMLAKPERFGDMLAEVADRAGHQNEIYLEIMHTLELGAFFGLTGGVELSGDVAADYETLMASPLGAAMPALVANAQKAMDEGFARKDMLLKCGTAQASPGCDVEIRILHQVIRELEPNIVYPQFILGWQLMAADDRIVGMNLVAPEDDYVALRDYTYHMQMIDHLYQTQGAQNVSLHAGELWLGLVRPKQLRFHIREAINIGHAKRIGHGMDIGYETNSDALLKQMAEGGIMVEINLTSNDVILGVKEDEHPYALYKKAGVPMALSTDDEGVARNDLTHEYKKAVEEHGLSYKDLKQLSRNGLTYSFLPGKSLWDIKECKKLKATDACDAALKQSLKATKQWDLEARFKAFEAPYKGGY